MPSDEWETQVRAFWFEINISHAIPWKTEGVMFDIEIDGVPVSWKAHGGYGRRSFNPRYLERQFYQFEIKKKYFHNLPLTVAVKIDCTFYMPIPSSLSKKKREKMLIGRVQHIKRPDVSNLYKFLEDTLKEIVIKDDSQVVEIAARKFYAEKPRTVVHLTLAGMG